MNKPTPRKKMKREPFKGENWRRGYEAGIQEERQFILNILDGIDIADEEMKNKGGGTKAIRLALQSRLLPLTNKKKR